MTYVPIYLPDGSIGVDWYITEDKLAQGVDRISQSWIRHDIGPRRIIGYQPSIPRPPVIRGGRTAG